MDELRFGPQRTLNLREHLPSAPDAVRRADRWLREQQVHGSREVLLITGRGAHSPGGVAVIRPAVEKLLHSLRRQGVVASHEDHTPGAFVVQLAPLRALVDAPSRRREPRRALRPVGIHGLSATAMDLLRQVAERSLDALGVVPDDVRISDEMHRYLSLIGPSLSATATGPGLDASLQSALRAVLAEFD